MTKKDLLSKLAAFAYLTECPGGTVDQWEQLTQPYKAHYFRVARRMIRASKLVALEIVPHTELVLLKLAVQHARQRESYVRGEMGFGDEGTRRKR